MNALAFSFFAASCASISNLFFRNYSVKSDHVPSINGYLFLFYLFSLVSSLIFYPEIFSTKVNFILLGLGALVGTLNVSLMLLTSKALSRGPSGLTFAFQNASAVFPGMLLFLFFGTDFGFSFSLFQAIGISLVLAGLFLGIKQTQSSSNSHSHLSWIKYAIACFSVQVLALTIIQGRCVLFDCIVDKAEDIWFMPGLFGSALLLQGFLFFSERRILYRNEITFGFLAGVFNFAATGLLLLATKFALPVEKGLLFPCFAVSTMILCNAWANRLYKEDFKIFSNAFCAAGIFMGMFG